MASKSNFKAMISIQKVFEAMTSGKQAKTSIQKEYSNC